MFDKVTEVNLLYDFYSQLLTDKQREVLRLYHCENFSLSEIADDLSISRQGVHDTLKNAEKALFSYEKKLNLVKKFTNTEEAIKAADIQIDGLISNNIDNKDLADKLYSLKNMINGLGQ